MTEKEISEITQLDNDEIKKLISKNNINQAMLKNHK